MDALPFITEKGIESLEISTSLKMMLLNNKLDNLKELLKRPMVEWFEFRGFSQHLLQELMNFLKNENLLSFVTE